MDATPTLVARLRALGLKLAKVAGDGNCQFRAVSLALFGTEDRHVEVRQHAVQYMCDHFTAEQFNAYKDAGDDPLNVWTEKMSRDCHWGDDISLTAIMHHYSINIKLVQAHPAYCPWYVLKVANPTQEITLAYHDRLHYDGTTQVTPTPIDFVYNDFDFR